MKKSALLAAALVGLALSACHPPAFAHDAPAGWSYPFACCSGLDCRQVDEKAVLEHDGGYTIRATGEFIHSTDHRIKPSPDGLYHWCSVGGADDSGTICLFVPGKFS